MTKQEMTRLCKLETTPGGRSTRKHHVATKHSDSGELGQNERASRSALEKLPYKTHPRKTHSYIGTFNIQTLIQTGKLHTFTEELKKQKIKIIAVQETRFTDSETSEYNGYRIFKSGTQKRVAKGAPILGMAFLVDKTILDAVTDVKSINNRLMTLRLKHKNKKYTFINVHAPTNGDNKKDPENTDKYWEDLELTMSKIPENDVKILLGDFNAQLGKERRFQKTIGDFPAHKFTNKNGIRLVELCKQFNMKIMSTSLTKKPKKQKTWRSPIHQFGEFQIDHIAISYEFQKEIHDVQVRKGANIDSDHYLTRIKIKMTPRRMRKQRLPTIPKFNVRKIKNTGTTEKWDEIQTNNWQDFKNKIINIAKETIPLTKKPKHPWWNEECEDALRKRQEAFLNYNSQKNEGTHKMFLETRKLSNKTIRQNKRKYVNEQLKSMEENFRNYNTHDFYKTFANQVKGFVPQNLCFKKSNGKLALTNQENCQELAGYFERLLNCEQPKERFPKQPPKFKNPDSKPPTQEEIEKHIKRLKSFKTSGEDGIVAELLKNLGTNSIRELTTIIQQIWETEIIPEEWKIALIHPLHKKGDKTDVNNYRGISLLPVTYKILSACLLQRTQEQIESKIAEYQAGFRPNRSCAEQIFNLKNILKIKNKRSKPIICVFVDFKKAYDSIDRKALAETLEEYGLDDKTRRLIMETLTDTQSKVKFLGEISKPFEIKTGVRQGDGLSPLMFNVVLDKVMKEWEIELRKEKNWKPIKFGRIEIPYLAFADDLAIMTENIENTIIQIEKLKECADKVGLQISFEKTEFIGNRIESERLLTQYGKINRVKHFKYLGDMIEPNGSEKISQNYRLQKMKRALGMVQNLYNKKSLSIGLKIRHYNTVMKPTALYASETLTMNRKGEMEDLKKEERKIIRKILGPRQTKDGYRLQKIETIEKLSNIEKDMRKRRAKFYGHIQRLPEGRLTKQVFEQLNKWKDTTNWMKETRKDLQQANIKAEDITDRNTYKNKINKWEVALETKPKQYRPKWTNERKAQFSQQMKTYWKDKKNKKLRPFA